MDAKYKGVAIFDQYAAMQASKQASLLISCSQKARLYTEKKVK